MLKYFNLIPLNRLEREAASKLQKDIEQALIHATLQYDIDVKHLGTSIARQSKREALKENTRQKIQSAFETAIKKANLELEIGFDLDTIEKTLRDFILGKEQEDPFLQTISQETKEMKQLRRAAIDFIDKLEAFKKKHNQEVDKLFDSIENAKSQGVVHRSIKAASNALYDTLSACFIAFIPIYCITVVAVFSIAEHIASNSSDKSMGGAISVASIMSCVYIAPWISGILSTICGATYTAYQTYGQNDKYYQEKLVSQEETKFFENQIMELFNTPGMKEQLVNTLTKQGQAFERFGQALQQQSERETSLVYRI